MRTKEELNSTDADPLRESERQFRKMIDALPAAIYTTDAEGRLTHFNPAAIECSGRVPELGTDQWCVTWKLYHSDGTPMRHDECPMAIALKEGRIVHGADAIAERPDGKRICFTPYPTPLRNEEGQIIGGINMLVDTTERKKADDALRRAEQELRDLVENASVAMHRAGADGMILWANQTELDMLGYSREEYIGHHIAEFHADQPVIEQILQRLMSGETLQNYEARLRHKDGSIRYALINSNVLWENGKFIHTRCFTRDITDRKLAEEALREAHENLRAHVQDLSRFNRIAVGRELRMIELKKEVNEFCHRQGLAPRYPLEFEASGNGNGNGHGSHDGCFEAPARVQPTQAI